MSATPLRVVFLAFEFPPLSAGGVHRALAFAEHLAGCNIALDVVTVRTEDYAAWSSAPLDEALSARIPPSVRVHRIASGFPAWYWRALRSKIAFRAMQYAYWGDPLAFFWRGPLIAAMDRLVAEQRPDVLLATMPPFGVAVLASALARRYRLPWVGDWRDPWTLWRMSPFPTYAHYRHVKRAEGEALASANVSVATSHVTRADWLALFPSLDPARVVTIYNGYDTDILGRVDAPDRDGTRRIAYVGTFYYDPIARAYMLTPHWRRAPQRWLFYTPRREDWLYRSPYFFLTGLRRFAERRPDLAAKLRVDFAGAIPRWLPGMLRETGTEALVQLHGPVTHEQAIRLEKGADAVLLTSAKVLDGGRDYSIAGKVFEYIGLRRPILAVLTDGAMRDIVAQTGLGVLADPDDPSAVADAIERVVLGPSVSPDDAAIAKFDRRETVRLMAESLRRAAAEGFRG
jgi:glycosyltransferase involved in cell wall biosynthesis